jgi:hypothetical protein
MPHRALPAAARWLSVAALVCWIVTFLAGTDVWHAAGSPVWTPGHPGYFDLRVLAIAYYALAPLLVVQAVVAFMPRGT